MQIEVESARAKVRGWFKRDGSILANNITSECTRIEVDLQIESPEPPERVAQLIANAERSCFVMQSLRKPVEAELKTTLNGVTLAVPA